MSTAHYTSITAATADLATIRTLPLGRRIRRLAQRLDVATRPAGRFGLEVVSPAIAALYAAELDAARSAARPIAAKFVATYARLQAYDSTWSAIGECGFQPGDADILEAIAA